MDEKIAALDVGSNTIRMVIAARKEGGRIAPLRYGRAITRLGRGLVATGELSHESMDATVDAVRGFMAVIGAECAALRMAAGTSALREAHNAPAFITRLKRETGLSVRVITGDEEAAITAMGVILSLPPHPLNVIFDIGGGSTEFVLAEDGRAVNKFTMPVGVVKLLEAHIHSDPPSRNELEGLGAECRHAAMDAKGRLGVHGGGEFRLVGTAGTVTTLAAIELGMEEYDASRVQGFVMGIGQLEAMAARMSGMTLAERAGIRGLEPGRADLIIPGVTLTIEVMRALESGRIVVSDQGLLEGLLSWGDEG